METLKFEWNTTKSQTNSKKHGVSFDEAKTAFFDEHAIQFYDPDHSENEDRYILLGTSTSNNTLLVCHCFRENETSIRIISARKADNDESQAYWSNRL